MNSIARGPRLDLFLFSFLILFFELAAIRWFGAMVVFLAFFTNIVLLACFLGMSVGLMAARRPTATASGPGSRPPRSSSPGRNCWRATTGRNSTCATRRSRGRRSGRAC